MPPFRPLFRLINIRKKNLLSMTLNRNAEHVFFKSVLKMTVNEIPTFENSGRVLTLPELPEEFLKVVFCDDDEYQIEEIEESYPLAISDVITGNILSSKKLSFGENVKEIYLIELSSSCKSYNPGDTIGIKPQNRYEDVQKLFDHLKITGLSAKKCRIMENHVTSKKNQKPFFCNKITTLEHIFTHFLDIHCIPKKSLIRLLSEFAKDVKEKEQLEELCSKENSDLYVKKILEADKTFLNLLLAYPSCHPPVARLIENLPKLLPRPYSIASSPLVSPNKVRIVFSVIKRKTEDIICEGICSGMLKQIINDPCSEKKLKFFFRKCNGFNLPESDVPLILIGPGTGIAPFIGFLEHRWKQSTKGIIWLFYGCRSKTGDYLFEEELQRYQELGVLTKLCVAFSRDCDTQAKYVQDNIKKHSKELCELIFEKAALIYVCGDAKNMRKDIQISFVEVFENQKGWTNKEATDYVKKLQKEKRYLQDIWN